MDLIKRILLFVYTALHSVVAIAQGGGGGHQLDLGKLTEILPPPPNAAEIGKYGGIDVGLPAGTPSINIPLWTVKSRTLTVPITLSYSSGGVKVDQTPSRVGMNWIINAGGVITRTVYGKPDESFTFLKHANYMVRDQAFLDYLNAVTNNTYDTEHDLFSFNFNGMSGKFMLDSAGHIYFLEKSNCRIVSNFGPSPTWTFKITDPQGIDYYFGGTTATEKSRKLQSACGKSFSQWAPVSWYITKIIDPGVDTINFVYNSINYTYATGLSQTATTSPPQKLCPCNLASCPITGGTTTCVQDLETDGVILTEIQTSTYTKVLFRHQSNPAIDQDSLVKSIQVQQLTGSTWTPFRKISLAYTTAGTDLAFLNDYNTDTYLKFRPFLSGVTIYPPDSSASQVYSLTYENPALLPPRLSFAQDIYGFFNGKANSTLIYPTGDDNTDNQFGSFSFANRTVDPDTARQGLLTKVKYPTGGYDTLVYEPNDYYSEDYGSSPTNTVSLSVSSAQFHQIVNKKDTFNIPYNFPGGTPGKMHISASVAEPGAGSPHNVLTIRVYNKATLDVVFEETLREDREKDSTLSFAYNQDYVIEMEAEAEINPTFGDVTIVYPIAAAPLIKHNVITSGFRIASIATIDPVASNSSIKRYTYRLLADTSQSSGYFRNLKPVNYRYYSQFIDCPYHVDEFCSQGILNLQLDCGKYLSILSSSQNNLYVLGSSPITYTAVTESQGNQYENGGIEHVFLARTDIPASMILNDAILGAPYTNRSWTTGLETYRHTFKIMPNGLRKPVQKVYNTYKEDTRGVFKLDNFVFEKLYSRPPSGGGVGDDDFLAFNGAMYYWNTNWTYLDSTATVSYAENGIDSSISSVKMLYENASHLQLTRQQTKNSKGQALLSVMKYPGDKASITGLTTNASIAIDTMIARNITTGVMETEGYVAGNLQTRIRNNYKLWTINGKNFTAQENVEAKIGSNAVQRRVDFTNYNQWHQLEQQSKVNDVRKSYLWGYKNTMPVAEAVNAKSNEIFFESFEEPGTWNSLTAYDNTKAHAGRTAARIDNPGPGELYCHSTKILNVTLTAPTKYKYSGWVYSNGPGLALFLMMKRAGEPGYTTYYDSIGTAVTGAWTFLEKEFTVPADVVQLNMRIDNNATGTAWYDDIRLHPSVAMMTTYTYDPMVGMTSQTDVTNKTSYYEYDAFGRLTLIRDKDGKILKKICYDYAGQVDVCSVDKAPLWQSTGTLRCQACPANPVYTSNVQEHQEKDNNPYSLTYNSIRWISNGVSGTCVPAADWQNTATALRCKTVSGINTGEREREQKDMNPCSATYNTLRWVVADQNCSVCPKPANWQVTGTLRCTKDGSNNNTGYQEREERDNETCSATYNQTRWISLGVNCATCPKPGNWQATGNLRCVKDGSNNNTGYQEREEKDLESCSGTYNSLRWVANGYNATACPVCATTCTGEGYKCINNICELGTRIYTSSIQLMLHKWRCYYYYEWSDGSTSGSYNALFDETCIGL